MSSPAAPSKAASAIRETHGNLAAAAKRLGMTRSALQSRVDRSAALRAIVEEERAELVDFAETQLRRAIANGEDWAIRYALDSARATPRRWRKGASAPESDAAPAERATAQPTLEEMARAEMFDDGDAQ